VGQGYPGGGYQSRLKRLTTKDTKDTKETKTKNDMPIACRSYNLGAAGGRDGPAMKSIQKPNSVLCI
ncbi:MAG: hypothetical protein ACXWCW_27275, partial [Burkholderiales bacterium]